MIAQSIGVTNGDKRLKQNPIIRKTRPNCNIISKICLLLFVKEFFIWFEFKG
jgi:hypothetical protein